MVVTPYRGNVFEEKIQFSTYGRSQQVALYKASQVILNKAYHSLI